jgi:hypothetical protein
VRSGRVLEVVATVTAFDANAVYDQYDDGEFATYDRTTIEIVGPEELLGGSVSFLHNRPVDEDSPWRAVGGLIAFEIDEDDLLAEGVLFDGAVQNLRSVEG